MASFLSKKKLKIVFWDDEARTGKKLQFTEIEQGFKTYEWIPYIFTDKEEIKKAAMESDIDAVVLDLMENGKPVGLEILTYLKEKKPFLPIVMFTIHDDIQYIQSAMRGDVSYFLTMPVKSFHDVMRAVEVAVEKEMTKERLVQDRYYVTIGKLAAGVAHSIKNSLWNIGSRAQILLDETDKSDKYYSLLETIKRRCDAADKVVKDLLNFARKGDRAEKMEELNITAIIRDMLRLIDLELKFYKIELIFNNAATDVKILGDEFLLKEAFLNLLKNTIEAMPDGGKLSIELSNTEKFITIKVSDTGVGMSKETLENLFIPFYTTKKDSVGFGLFETQRIIQKHNGTIRVESEERKGSTFNIELPLLTHDKR